MLDIRPAIRKGKGMPPIMTSPERDPIAARLGQLPLDTIAAQAGELRAFLGANPFDQVVLTGCGSTYYLALAAAASLREIANMLACRPAEPWLARRAASRPAGARCPFRPSLG